MGASTKRAARPTPKKPVARAYNFHLGRRRIRVILDKVLIFRFLRNVHGRFWGLAAINVLIIGFSICFLIRPDLLQVNAAFSDFGTDVRTAPYFAGAVFFGAYGLWRWRNYLSRTWKRNMPILGFLTLTIFGLYLVALMPIAWKPWPYRVHLFGISLVGVSMVLTVVFDGLLTRTRTGRNAGQWRFLRLISFMLIVVGGWLTLGSIPSLQWYHLALVGELMMLAGYGLWIGFKTYQGEGARSAIGRLLKNFVLID